MAVYLDIAVLKGDKFIRWARKRPARSLPDGFVGVVVDRKAWPVYRHRYDGLSIDIDGVDHDRNSCGFLEQSDIFRYIDDTKGSENMSSPVKLRKSARLIPIPELDSPQSDLPVYAIGFYISQRSGKSDAWSDRIIGFKDRNQTDIKGGIRVLSEAAKEILSLHDLDPETMGLLSALSSKDVAADPMSSLQRAGKFVAQHCGVKWLPKALTKKSHRKLAHIKGPEVRDNEVKGKYQCMKLNGIQQIIIMDDIVTRGATMGEIKRAIKASNPSVQVIGLALGKTDSKGDNSGTLDIWGPIWDTK